MKRIYLLLLLAFSVINALAQSAANNGIAVSPYVASDSGVPNSAEAVLENKLRNLITGSGMIADANQRFILTAQVTPLSEDVTDTAPVKYVYTLSVNLYFGDGISGKLFTSANFETKGVGNSKSKAYLAALKSLSPGDSNLKSMLKDAQAKVIDYYTSQGPSLLSQAQAAANMQNYDEAFFLLDQIPSACPDLFEKANEMKMQIYHTAIAEDGERELAQARAIWNAGQDRDAADRAGQILAKINPQSPAFKEAQALHNQISSRIKAIDDREWNFELQKQKDETSVRREQLRAVKDIAVAKAKNQPKTIYHIRWW